MYKTKQHMTNFIRIKLLFFSYMMFDR